MTRWFKGFGKVFFRICLLAMAGWATVAILYSNLPDFLRPWIAGIFGIGSLLALVGSTANGGRGWDFWLHLRSCLSIGFCSCRQPTTGTGSPIWRLWPGLKFSGNKVTVHNIRNCDYRTETDFTVHHYDKTFDLSKLKGVDFSLVYWGSPNIAHTMMSFDFEGEGNVCFSIETRKEKGEDLFHHQRLLPPVRNYLCRG